MLFVMGLLMIPVAAQGQGLEIGLDGGMQLNTGFEVDESLTQFSIPTGYARVGVPVGNALSIEALLSFMYASSGDNSFDQLTFIPGANFSFGTGGGYVRGEAAVTRAGSGNGTTSGSSSQFGLGAAAGLKKAIAGGPVSFRLEGGFLRWFENTDDEREAYNQLRVLVGISAAIG
jgi:hypothetical protein